MTSIKDKILQRFLAADGEPISGQQLADELLVSRTAIWKHMQALQQDGYTFEVVKKKGYKLLAKSNKLDEMQIAAHLTTARYGHKIHHYDEVDSTQILAHEFIRNGAADGTVIIAEKQTAGRGRMQRPWDSAEGHGVWMTTIIRPNVLPHQAPQFTLVTAVALVHAISDVCQNFKPSIKWPNDILINGKKCAGILTEMVAEADRIQALLVGTGINVNQQQEDFPEELHSIATSMAIEEGQKIDRAVFVAKFLGHLEHFNDIYVKEGFAPIKTLWEAASGTIGKHVRATTLREVIEGQAIGITEAGVLEIRTANGEIKSVYSADIEVK
ncbi:biotin--[acetyl-CoA-carboxylase] ligase [Bacillus ndiopicus]|uniref:biotin--[acetyl-CoA-carboxylase] ligase n=1 Tax=Bacillus ndiopicus TaxID=1347368 RepID=UPI0005A98D15|nr:biotin--[acetyl-CoA-carboxylase] ligase [Bacillus ndiopicus]